MNFTIYSADIFTCDPTRPRAEAMAGPATPIEAGLAWSISPARRAGGAREGGFPGADRILAQMAGGAPRPKFRRR